MGSHSLEVLAVTTGMIAEERGLDVCESVLSGQPEKQNFQDYLSFIEEDPEGEI